MACKLVHIAASRSMQKNQRQLQHPLMQLGLLAPHPPSAVSLLSPVMTTTRMPAAWQSSIAART